MRLILVFNEIEGGRGYECDEYIPNAVHMIVGLVRLATTCIP
jgi:hypothetical protein